jgi:hypothetical protein
MVHADFSSELLHFKLNISDTGFPSALESENGRKLAKERTPEADMQAGSCGDEMISPTLTVDRLWRRWLLTR